MDKSSVHKAPENVNKYSFWREVQFSDTETLREISEHRGRHGKDVSNPVAVFFGIKDGKIGS